ncbi:PilW family protein [Vibrio cortegadensis]|uniref:PilW family protein n=1 Tax=Vibrio cortegadensis TaxID=1328770 RepID=A0ABV4M5R6_9VIBR|nr:MSHA biogenesis protein MshO [Vibrionales bacterium C3R12]
MKNRGFTLIEMVLTMVVGGIIVLGIAGFVELGTKGYADSIDRQRMQTQAQFVIEKLSREFRHAVPNSFEVPVAAADLKCLSFYPIKYSGFYAKIGDDIQFLIGNSDLAANHTLAENLRLAINPTRRADLFGENTSIDVSGQTATENIYTLAGATATLHSSSISNRFYIFDTNERVNYCMSLTGRSIVRNGVQVADNVEFNQSGFSYKEPTLQRGGLVYIDLLFEQDGEQSAYKQDVQVLNVP